MDIVLVGLPGSGKSAVGRRLAHRHDATFIDLDERIETRDRADHPGDLRRRRARPPFGRSSDVPSPTWVRRTPRRRSRRVIAPAAGRSSTHATAGRSIAGGRSSGWTGVPRSSPSGFAGRRACGRSWRPRSDRGRPRSRGEARALLCRRRHPHHRGRRGRRTSSAPSRRAWPTTGSGDGTMPAAGRDARSDASSSATGSPPARSPGRCGGARPAERSSSPSPERGRPSASRSPRACVSPAGRSRRSCCPRARTPSACRWSRARRASWSGCEPTEPSRWWRSVAARSATPPGSWPRPTCAACRSSTFRPRSSHRSIPRSAGRPESTCRKARTSSGRSICLTRRSWTSRRWAPSPSAIVEPRWARPSRWRRWATSGCSSCSSPDGPAIAAGADDPDARGVVAELVERCAWAKVEVVLADEREHDPTGGRITLNLGHSVGHALEATAGYSGLLHGEAVAYGLRAACAIGRALDITPADRAERITAPARPAGAWDGAAGLPAGGRDGASRDRQEARGRLAPLGPAHG